MISFLHEAVHSNYEHELKNPLNLKKQTTSLKTDIHCKR